MFGLPRAFSFAATSFNLRLLQQNRPIADRSQPTDVHFCRRCWGQSRHGDEILACRLSTQSRREPFFETFSRYWKPRLQDYASLSESTQVLTSPISLAVLMVQLRSMISAASESRPGDELQRKRGVRSRETLECHSAVDHRCHVRIIGRRRCNCVNVTTIIELLSSLP
jgi:hypothetical protein